MTSFYSVGIFIACDAFFHIFRLLIKNFFNFDGVDAREGIFTIVAAETSQGQFSLIHSDHLLLISSSKPNNVKKILL